MNVLNALNSESLTRLAVFLGVFGVMAVAELLIPRRRLNQRRPLRWSSNLGLVCLNAVAVRVLLPTGAVGLAMLASERRWGLLNNVGLPAWVAVILAVVALDFAIYLQHVIFHAVPALWRLHMVHHADLDFDVTTGIRFHTVEVLLSMGIKMGAVVVLGPPAVGVLIFELLLNATSMFSHGNIRLPAGLDRVLRLFVVTPDMHRVHHSVIARETNSNFGFNLPWWDLLLGTYRAQPADGHDGMKIGLSQFRDERVEQLHRMLLLPFGEDSGEYPINRRESGKQSRPVESPDVSSAAGLGRLSPPR